MNCPLFRNILYFLIQSHRIKSPLRSRFIYKTNELRGLRPDQRTFYSDVVGVAAAYSVIANGACCLQITVIINSRDKLIGENGILRGSCGIR